MPNGLTIDELYEAYMDIDEYGEYDDTSFAADIFRFMDLDKAPAAGELPFDMEEWTTQWGMYLPSFDPTQTHLAERERDLAYRSAMDTLKATQDATDRVYKTEMDTLSTGLGREMSKARDLSGRIGLRSGTLESATSKTIADTGSKAKDFGDRLRIAEDEMKDKYNNAMVDAALDFEKTEYQEKEEFYDRTMAMLMRLMDKEAFDFEKCDGYICDDGVTCVDSKTKCPEWSWGPDDPNIIQEELSIPDELNIDICNPPCRIGQQCISGVCMDASTLSEEDPRGLLCGDRSVWVEGHGCVDDFYGGGDVVHPEDCPAGTIWDNEAGGCLYWDPNEGKVGCTGPCAEFLMYAETAYDAAQEFYTAQWNFLHDPLPALPGDVPVEDADEGEWYDWLYCLLPTSNC